MLASHKWTKVFVACGQWWEKKRKRNFMKKRLWNGVNCMQTILRLAKNSALDSLSNQLRLCTHAALNTTARSILSSLSVPIAFNASCCINTNIDLTTTNDSAQLRSFAHDFKSLSPKRDSVDESRKCKRAAAGVELISICNFGPSHSQAQFCV